MLGPVTIAQDSRDQVVVFEVSPAHATAFGGAFPRAGYRVSALAACAIDLARLLRLSPDPILLDVSAETTVAG